MTHDFKKFPELTNSQMQFYYFESPHKQIFNNFLAKIIKVTDGDTVRVKCDFRDFDFPIRLANIAAAEMSESGGKESRAWLESRILNEEVEILVNTNNRVGKFGRLIGEILHAGININEEALRERNATDFANRKLNKLIDFETMIREFAI